MTAAPPAAILTVQRNARSGERTVIVLCPFGCKSRRHVHGWPDGRTAVGRRLSHCGGGEYDVVLLPWAPPTYVTRRGPNKRRPVRA